MGAGDADSAALLGVLCKLLSLSAEHERCVSSLLIKWSMASCYFFIHQH